MSWPVVTRYSLPGSACTARITSSPRSPDGMARMPSSPRETASTVTHGRRSTGTASAAAGCTSPTSRPAESATASAARAGPDSAARRCASASGVPVGTTNTGRASRIRSMSGNRELILASRMAWVAPCQRVNATSSMKTMPNAENTRVP